MKSAPVSVRHALALGLMLGAAAHAQPAAAPQSASTAALAYRNAVTPPPPGWTGPVFQLSHDYPKQDPGSCPPNVCRWLVNDKVSFAQVPGDPPPQWNAAWAEYMQQILDYIREGQNAQLDNTAGWQVKVGGETRWFHVPWMAYDPTHGREFVHGLTNERTAALSDFRDAKHTHKGLSRLMVTATQESQKEFETWAFGVYNPYGAYAIGRTWEQNGQPLTVPGVSGNQPAGLPFPAGTLVAKLLFTTATPKDVPYLAGSPAWQADRHIEKDGTYECQRAVQEVRLVQLDIAVVDPRSPTRWVFGTFAYNGKLKGKTAWERLSPVGVQWGSDPWTFPAVPKTFSIPAIQSVLNTKIGIPEHFGCNGRLAGPVDNKLSSCLSCHGGGYAPPAGQAATATNTPPIFGYTGQCTSYSLDNSSYFNNGQFPMAYSGGQYPGLMSMDTSLQMQVAFFQFGQYTQFHQPQPCTMQ